MEQLHGAPAEDVDTDATNCANAAQAEIDTYFSLPVAPMDTDVLEWWSKHEAWSFRYRMVVIVPRFLKNYQYQFQVESAQFSTSLCFLCISSNAYSRLA